MSSASALATFSLKECCRPAWSGKRGTCLGYRPPIVIIAASPQPEDRLPRSSLHDFQLCFHEFIASIGLLKNPWRRWHWRDSLVGDHPCAVGGVPGSGARRRGAARRGAAIGFAVCGADRRHCAVGAAELYCDACRRSGDLALGRAGGQRQLRDRGLRIPLRCRRVGALRNGVDLLRTQADGNNRRPDQRHGLCLRGALGEQCRREWSGFGYRYASDSAVSAAEPDGDARQRPSDPQLASAGERRRCRDPQLHLPLQRGRLGPERRVVGIP